MRRPTPGQIGLALGGILALAYVGHKVVLALRSDEERVRRVLQDVAQGVRERDAGRVLEYFDPQYRDAHGHAAEDVRGGVRYLLLRATSVEAELEVLAVAVAGDTATARVRASATIKVQGQAVTIATGGFRGEMFDVELRRHESYFRIAGAREAADTTP
jgi:ketosteroid isomerase-like protein